jgi:lipopolysaccharide export LptBFGC system permease protein LptF
MRRPPLILWCSILVELWRLILMTAAILVIVLAFAAAVRFLADGRLGPVETIRLMFLAMPPMLQYALPFAAGFGATLAYHRACTDNELIASYAAGVSHRSLLVPAVVSGAILSVGVLVLSNVVIPRFLRSMEHLVTRDAARFIVASIERKEAVQIENMLLYADLVRKSPDTGGGAYERLYMKGVVVVELDKDGHVKFQVSAREADIWLVRAAAESAAELATGDTVTHVIVRSRGTIGQKTGDAGPADGEGGGTPAGGGGGVMEGESMNLARTIPNAFSDDPKFLAWDELMELRNDPGRINFINSRRRVLAAHLAERATTGAIARALAETGSIHLDQGEGAAVTISARSIAWDEKAQHWVFLGPPASDAKSPPALPVERRFETGRVTRQFAQAATFRTAVDPDSPDREVTVTLTLSGISAPQGTPGARAGALKPQTIAQLSVPQANVASIMNADAAELITAADERLKADPTDAYVQKPRDELRKRIADLMREITSKQQERLASAAACLVMTLTGAVMAIRLRSKLPLEVYLWAFFPALATVMTISAGQQMIHSQGMIGIPLMWAGVAGLAIYTFLQFRHVARH